MNFFRYLFSPKMLAPALAVTVVGLLGYTVFSQAPANAANCSNNDVVRCGYSNPADLANKTAGNGELQKLYNHDFTPGYGIGDLNNWKANAKHATAYKDGRIVLDDGTVVGTNAQSLGRERITGNRFDINIGGKVYHHGPNRENFASGSLSAYVLLNKDDHSLQFAALTACGNPTWASSPAYKCQMLNREKVNDTTYNFSTSVVNRDAGLTKLVYDFGDGKTHTVTSNFGQKVSHTYGPGKYTAKVTAYFNVHGKEKSDTRVECTKPVEVPQPPKPVFTCDSLTPKQLSRTKYSFTAKGSSKDATFVSGNFQIDGSNVAGKVEGPQTISVEREFTDGDHTIKAFLTYKEGTTQETAKCTAKITINKETCADKPNAPECQPPKTCADTPDAPECKPKEDTTPKVLPSTGPIEIIGSALGLSSVAGASLYYRSSRRNLLDVIFKR